MACHNSDTKIVQDCIHGAIELKPLICKIVDTEYFQRQRNLYQLGMNSFVYPTASHCRFEHAIGTYYLASKFLSHLFEKQPEVRVECDINDQDILCVEIAALCHDIGHGPFSHVWDNIFIPRLAKKKKFDALKHEDWSARILDLLFKKIEDSDEYKKSGLGPHHIRFIKCLILGYRSLETVLSEEDKRELFGEDVNNIKKKQFLFEIVSNDETKVDVDKWDYLARDSLYLGCGSLFPGFSIQRYMLMYRVEECDDEAYHLVLRKSETFNIMGMFQMRHHLHRIAYQHRVTKTLEEMICDAFESADDVYQFSNISTKRGDEIPEENVERYLRLSDFLFWEIFYSTDPNLETAKTTIHRILQRDLYKIIHVERIDNPEDIDQAISCAFEKDRFRLSKAVFDFGAKGEFPLDYLHFFEQKDGTKEIKVVKGQDNYSKMLMPKIVRECELRLIDCRTGADRCANNKLSEEAIEDLKKSLVKIINGRSSLQGNN